MGGDPTAVFLDRDGVINEERRDFVRSVADWVPLPGSLEAIARLSRAGRRVVVVTNQSGLARGVVAPEDLEAIHRTLERRVAEAGGRIAGIFHCPHRPEAGCACRKPRAGLIERAVETLGLESRGAPLVGDRESDVEAARAAGCRPILVRSERTPSPGVDGVPVYESLAAWVEAELGG